MVRSLRRQDRTIRNQRHKGKTLREGLRKLANSSLLKSEDDFIFLDMS
jgi:hypothetical protein